MKNNNMNSNIANKETKNMKSKNLIKRIIAVAMLTAIIMVEMLLSACKTESIDFQTKVNATESAKVVTCKINVKDGETEVYDYTKTITVDGENATVAEKTKSLGDGFQFVESEKNSEVTAIDKTTFCPLNVQFFQAGMTEEKQGPSSKYSVTVDKATVQALIGLALDVDIQGEGTLYIITSDSKVLEMNLSYKTSTGKDVTVLYKYKY